MPGFTAVTDGSEHSDNVARSGSAGSSVYPAAGSAAAFTAAAVTISVGAGCGGGGRELVVVEVTAGGTRSAVLGGAAVTLGDVVAVGMFVGTVCQGRQRRAAAATAATTPAASRAFARKDVRGRCGAAVCDAMAAWF